MDYPVVLVTFNYRLGLLGFLNTEDENAYGNYGLVDQVMLLKWVQTNIDKFGGDPKRVTLYGESSGGASVIYHLISPLSSGLFHKAISSSGSAINPWALARHPLQKAQLFADTLGCSKTSDTKVLVQCFLNQTTHSLVQATRQQKTPEAFMGPSLESKGGPGFITEDPLTLMKQRKIANKVPVILGLNSFEGYSMYLIFGSLLKTHGKEFFQSDFKYIMSMISEIQPNMPEPIRLILKEYVEDAGDLDNDDIFTKVISAIIGDAAISAGVALTAELLSQAGVPTYAYKFDYIGQHCLAELIGGVCGKYASHSDELLYPFRVANIKLTNANDLNMTQTLDNLLTLFAADGDIEWPNYDQVNRSYLELNLTPTVRNGYLSDKMKFWTETIPQSIQKFFIAVNVFEESVFCNPVTDGSVVELMTGQVQGYTDQSTNGKIFYGFKGIPYVKPPARFQYAEPPLPWKGVLNATQDGKGCPQFDLFFGILGGSEDCLTANVYTPQLGSKYQTLLPVIVSIHGGAFIAGSGQSSVYGPQNLMDYPVVLVTFNYRLGLFGFLNTEDENAYGNYGLVDQVMLLKWVQTNVDKFGGDPKRVTIYGESAGGASVIYHLISPLSSGLFHKAISSSGSAISPWALDRHPLQKAQLLADTLGCPKTSDTKMLVQCFLNQTTHSLVQASMQLQALAAFIVPSLESKDGPGFITEDPLTLMKQRKIANKVPVILGANSFEGYTISLLFHLLFQTRGKEFFQNNFKNILPAISEIQPNMTEPIRLILKEYVEDAGDIDNDDIFTKVASEIIGDASISTKVALTAELLSQAGVPTYAYKFSYLGQHCLAEFVGGVCGKYASHGDELLYSFRVANIKMTNASDLKMTQTLDHLLTSFAADSDIGWANYDQVNRSYLELNLPPTIRNGYLSEKMKFWTETIPQSIQKCKTTGCS
ncbi:Carboxylesterase 5A [Chamberlinius hualienensis]